MKNLLPNTKRILTNWVFVPRLQFYPSNTGISRFCSGFLILALLSQVLIIGQISTVRASGNISAAPPISAPPEPFVVHNAGYGIVESSVLGSAFLSKAIEFFTEPESPTDFPIAKQSTFREKLVNGASSLFALIAPKSNAAASTNPNPAAPPMMTAGGSVTYDFDGDGKADIGRWHPANYTFEIKRSEDGENEVTTIGNSSSIPVPGKFDNDTRVDVAVFNAGTWTIKYSSDGTTHTITCGTSGDIPMAGDYDGDGRTDAAVFRPSTGMWIIKKSTAGDYSQQYGSSADIPISGDYDGDGKTDIAYFDSVGDWHIWKSTTNSHFQIHYGQAGDVPVQSDFNGDGKSDLAVFRPSNGYWYTAKISGTNYVQFASRQWGSYNDQPVPADYNGDGCTDYSVWRPTTGVWHTYITQNLACQIIVVEGEEFEPQYYEYQTLGVPGDRAIPSAYTKQIGGTVTTHEMAAERLKPRNATGGTNLYSQNFSWGTSLVGLPGRSGLNTGFGISYNSLVWIKSGSAMYFDPDVSNVSPGFRFGFPVIEPIYFTYGKGWSYMMVTPGGGRTEFLQQGVSNYFETVDSSYTQLKILGSSNPNSPVEEITMTVTTTDGTQMSYFWDAGAYRCTQIKDRNGNFITNTYTDGRLTTVTDTLGRVVTVNYNNEHYPTTITQAWSTGTHTWATLSYVDKTVDTDFSSSLSIFGPPDTTVIRVLDKITYADGSATQFEYNSYIQVKKISSIAPNLSPLNYVTTNLASPSSGQQDCPRFTQTKTQAENFNGGNEVIVNNSFATGQQYTLPDNSTATGTKIEVSGPNGSGVAGALVTKIYSASGGWAEALPVVTEDWVSEVPESENPSLTKKRWTWTNWEQDMAVASKGCALSDYSYYRNPRIKETQVGDATNNIKHTTIGYLLEEASCEASGSQLPPSFAYFGLVSQVDVYDGYLGTLMKRSLTEYNLDSEYLNRRIIGLTSQVEAWGYNDTTNDLEYVSKVNYAYDEEGYGNGQSVTATQHDIANYGISFEHRGNLTSTTRHDVLGELSSVTSHVKYNITGSPITQTDPVGRITKIGYTDNFNSSGNPATFAYPTTITDPAGSLGDPQHSSFIKYRYDIGANVEADSPAPLNNTYGKKTKRTFDSYGRLEREGVWTYSNGNWNEYSYVRNEFPTNGIQSKSFAPIVDLDGDGNIAEDEVLSENWLDGAGRIRQSRTEHPGSAGGWSAIKIEYDILGRTKRQSVPTEVTVSNPNDPQSWVPSGDDNRGNGVWLWNSTEYDWKGRVIKTIPSDSNGSDGKETLISYDGCGCAGEVTMVQGPLVTRDDQPENEARRIQKSYSDILGRTYKTETFKWNGTDLYTTTVNKFNGRDQVRESITTDVASQIHQDTTATYDGHGRLKTQHRPEQNPNTNTVYAYNADDTVHSTTDGRGVSVLYSYNNRKLVEWYIYNPGTNQTIGAEYFYDNLGNRTYMIDRLGTVSYEYDALSRMRAEERDFNDYLPNGPSTYRISYTYNLNGSLKSITDPYNQRIDYSVDKTGRTKTVTGSTYANNTQYISSIDYRSFGSTKSMSYSNNVAQSFTYDNALRVNSFEVSRNNNTTFQQDYLYYGDGNLRFSGDPNDEARLFNRSYEYDSVSRITEAQTGTQASGIPQPDLTQLPYSLSYSYNAFNNVLNWGGSNWTHGAGGDPHSYTNNRMADWDYDADGRMTSTNYLPTDMWNYYTYDLDGQISGRFVGALPVNGIGGSDKRIYQYRDGDGQLVKEKTYHKTGSVVQIDKAFYFIRSTVLGGKLLTETTTNGAKNRTLVYANDTVVAIQRGFDAYNNPSPNTVWQYSDPSETSVRSLNSNGNEIRINNESAELDPFASVVGFEAPPPDPIDHLSYGPYHSFGTSFTCLLDGVETPCNLVQQLVGSGAAEVCPYNSCGPITLYINSPITGKHTILTGSYRAGQGYPLRNAKDRGIFAGFLIEAGFLGAADFANYFIIGLGDETKKKKKKENEPTGGILDIFALIIFAAELSESETVKEATIDAAIYDSGNGYYIETNEGRNRLKKYLRKLISKKCGAAFRAAGLEKPYNVLANGGVIFAARETLRNSTNNAALGLSEAARIVKNQSVAPATTLLPQESVSGTRGVIFVSRDAFTTLQGNILNDFAAHEFIHGQGIGTDMFLTQIRIPMLGLTYGHDLSAFPGYDDIIKHCGLRP